jgi:hypothetical protein
LRKDKIEVRSENIFESFSRGDDELMDEILNNLK